MSLVEWDSLRFRLRGSRLEELAREGVRARGAPLADLTLRFLEGRLEIRGKAIMAISIPFSLEIGQPVASGNEVRFRIEQVAAFGFLPIPKFFFSLVEKSISQGGFTFRASEMTGVVALDQILPSFVDVEISEIHWIDGGVELLLGRGAADPPLDLGGNHETTRNER